jgi:hypothetical protein
MGETVCNLISLVCCFLFASSSLATTCETAYKKAVSQCSSYEHSITSDQLDNIGDATKKRMAERESLKLFSMGRSCAKAQKQCIKTCDQALESDNPQGDVASLIEFSNDCAQGSVADHRSKLAKRYLSMKGLAEVTRDPASPR